MYFNSSMVRLKAMKPLITQLELYISIPVWCDWRQISNQRSASIARFQFQYGAIEGQRRGQQCDLLRQFQFQYGAIEGLLRVFLHGYFQPISIPVWCDWRQVISHSINTILWISIPVWCDWRGFWISCNILLNFISIPVWCDWRPENFAPAQSELHFNSSMVRLKEETDPAHDYRFYPFQFQYGAIEGTMPAVIGAYGDPFQFQYGAIEGAAALFAASVASNFNSSMVRLKVCLDLSLLSLNTHFNSSMVRLKEREELPPREVEHDFNSSMVRLKDCRGTDWLIRSEISIPVWCDWRKSIVIVILACIYFNSSMVRLKVLARFCFHPIHQISIPVWCDWRCQLGVFLPELSIFQFQYGAIEGTSRSFPHYLRFYFNSSMVRLKVQHVGALPRTFIISIPVWCDWRFNLPCKSVPSQRISIPVWCDWRPYPSCSPRRISRISIPVWCDWRRKWITPDHHLPNISIPVWCDWRILFPSAPRVWSHISIPVWCDWRSSIS